VSRCISNAAFLELFTTVTVCSTVIVPVTKPHATFHGVFQCAWRETHYNITLFSKWTCQGETLNKMSRFTSNVSTGHETHYNISQCVAIELVTKLPDCHVEMFFPI
jgi:hypothetical protein